MKRVLLDTNSCSRFLGGDSAVLDAMIQADAIHLSVIVLGELQAGFQGGSRRAENERLLAEFLGRPRVSPLLLTLESAQVFGVVKEALRRAGTPIPINDVWLAAQAIETGSVLVTFDAHFRRVPGLRLWSS